MNKKNKQMVPLCFIVAALVFVAIVFTMVSSAYEEYHNADISKAGAQQNLETYKNQYEASKAEREKNEMQIQSIKQVYQTNVGTDNENLGVFGTMFEDIIKRAQYNGLMVRSIEYDMRPANDPLYAAFSDTYNVCELKFFLVGTYLQSRTFLNEIVNNFPYLISISKLNVTAFDGNTDYLLIDMSLTLYSKRPDAGKNK